MCPVHMRPVHTAMDEDIGEQHEQQDEGEDDDHDVHGEHADVINVVVALVGSGCGHIPEKSTHYLESSRGQLFRRGFFFVACTS